MSREQKIISTNGEPTSFDFVFDNPVPRLAINAFNADDPADRYYWRLIFLPESGCQIRFPVTPKNLAIEFVTDNPFGIKSYLKYPCKPREIDCICGHPSKRSFGHKDLKMVWVDDMSDTPIKIYVSGPHAGEIHGSKAARRKICQQQWAFLVDHEMRHVNHDDEEETDRCAFWDFMQQGYSISQAYYAMVHILGRGPADTDRKMNIWRLAQQFNEKYS